MIKNQWHVLWFGEHTTTTEGNCNMLAKHTSAVSVIIDEGKIVLIDTGNRFCFKKLVMGLKKIGLKINDITDVILTHFHLDHSGNIGRLKEHTKIFAWRHIWEYNRTIRIPTLDQYKITKNITIINTPGHTPEHNAVMYTNNNKKIIFAGDAINEQYFKTRAVKALNYDNTLYKKHADWIMDTAEIIVPGHGPLLTKNQETSECFL